MRAFEIGDIVELTEDYKDIPKGYRTHIVEVDGDYPFGNRFHMIYIGDQHGVKIGIFSRRVKHSTLDKPEDFEYDV